MMSSGNEISSLNGLLAFKTVYEKRGGLLWPFVSLTNLISLRSVAFITIFVFNLVQAHKFHVNLEIAGLLCHSGRLGRLDAYTGRPGP